MTAAYQVANKSEYCSDVDSRIPIDFHFFSSLSWLIYMAHEQPVAAISSRTIGNGLWRMGELTRGDANA